MTPSERIKRARTLLIIDQPFFGSLALRLQPNEDRTVESIITDGKRLRYNPEFVQSNTDTHLRGILAGLVLRIANGHCWRRGSRDVKTWNDASKQSVLPILRSSGFDFPPAYEDNGLAGSAEGIYSALKQKQDEQQEQEEQQTGNESEDTGQTGQDGQSSSSGSSKPEKSEKSEESDDAVGCARTDDQPEEASEGPEDDESVGDASLDDGADTDEDEQQDQNGSGLVEDTPADEARELEEDWKVGLSQATLAAKARGELPGFLARMVEKLITPTVPWTVLLRDFVERTARNDYAWNHPNPRHLGRGIVLPGLVSEELPRVVIAVDTSGSIDQETLDKFAAEVSAVLGAYESTISVLYIDTAVKGEETFTRADMPIKFNPVGGGGTDFRPAFDWITKEGLTPSCCIYLTDLYGRFPLEEPEYPVLWVATRSRVQKVPFGQLARMEDE